MCFIFRSIEILMQVELQSFRHDDFFEKVFLVDKKNVDTGKNRSFIFFKESVKNSYRIFKREQNSFEAISFDTQHQTIIIRSTEYVKSENWIFIVRQAKSYDSMKYCRILVHERHHLAFTMYVQYIRFKVKLMFILLTFIVYARAIEHTKNVR